MRLPGVATVHDLTPLLFPEWHSRKNRLGFTPFIGATVRRARRIAAVSEATRRDLVAAFPDAAKKTAVVHNGIEPEAPGAGGAAPHEGRPYVLYVGTLEPRKNVLRLVAAMESIWDRRPDFPDLVLAGGDGWGLGGFAKGVARSRHAARLTLAEYLGPGERARWLKEARVFAYPSLYEGFGLPPLEAMAQGTPVVGSSSSSLPEVMGDAGLLPDPTSVPDIAAALERAHDDADFRRHAAAEGPRRAGSFTWAAAAAKMRAPLRGGSRVTARRKRVLLDARKARDFGIGTYIRGLLGGLAGLDRFALQALVLPGDETLFPTGVTTTACAAAHYSFGELVAVRRAISAAKPDLFHAPHYVVPLFPPRATVVTIHDLMHLTRPEHATPAKRAYARWMIGRALRLSARVIAVSEATKKEILAFGPSLGGKVEVIPNGVREEFFGREEKNAGAPYLLFLGNDKPHKNLDGLLAAFARLRVSFPSLSLVLAGVAPGRVRAEGVHALGFVPDADVPALVAGARALVLPSFAEGFGLRFSRRRRRARPSHARTSPRSARRRATRRCSSIRTTSHRWRRGSRKF